jgi:hypothetical protein
MQCHNLWLVHSWLDDTASGCILLQQMQLTFWECSCCLGIEANHQAQNWEVKSSTANTPHTSECRSQKGKDCTYCKPPARLKLLPLHTKWSSASKFHPAHTASISTAHLEKGALLHQILCCCTLKIFLSSLLKKKSHVHFSCYHGVPMKKTPALVEHLTGKLMLCTCWCYQSMFQTCKLETPVHNTCKLMLCTCWWSVSGAMSQRSKRLSHLYFTPESFRYTDITKSTVQERRPRSAALYMSRKILHQVYGGSSEV